MDVKTVCLVLTCMITCGGVLVYIGRSLGTLDSIKEAVSVALDKTDQHAKDIAEIKIDIAKVKTRQEDCGNCP